MIGESILKSGRYYSVGVHSFGGVFSTWRGTAACIERKCSSCDLPILSYWTQRDRWGALPSGGLVTILPRKKSASNVLLLSDAEDVALTFSWIPPPDPVLALEPLKRARFGFWVSHTRGWELAERLLLVAVECADAFWGEIRDHAATVRDTYTMSVHHEIIPHLGTANYFGAEYVQFFGGVQKLEAAGFGRVVPHHRGAYVHLGAVANTNEFVTRRAGIEARLALPGVVFGARRRGPVPRFPRPLYPTGQQA